MSVGPKRLHLERFSCGLEKKVRFKWQKVAAGGSPLNRNQLCEGQLCESAGGLRTVCVSPNRRDKRHRA